MKKLFAVAALLLLFAVPAIAQQAILNGTARAILPATYTASEVDGPTNTNLVNTGVEIRINCSTYTSGTYTPHVQGIDQDGNAYDLLVGTVSASTVISGTGTIVLYVGKGYLPVPGVSAQAALPIKWRVILVGASTPNMFVVANANLGI